MERSLKRRRSDDMESRSLKRDWSEIPGHVLANVLERLIVADDFVKFGAVCVSWRSVFAEELGMTMKKKKRNHLLPFLLIPPHEEEEEENNHIHNKQICDAIFAKKPRRRIRMEKDHRLLSPPQPQPQPQPQEEERKNRSLYNLSKQKVCDFKLQLPHNKWCRGSCFGWLVNLEIDDSNHYSVQLHNPFLSNNHTIDLPSLDNIVEIDEQLAKRRIQPLCLQKAVLSANPTLEADYMVMAIMSDFGTLAFFKPGSKDWIPIDCRQFEDVTDFLHYKIFTDIIYYKKTQQFYAVHDLGAVFAIDFQQGKGKEDSSDHLIPKLTQVAPSTQNNWVSKRYLVESLSGDLLQVFKFMGSNESLERVTPANWISRFEVFKFDLTIGGEWIQIDSLGDAILFLGENSSFSMSASDIPGCKPNCIYFTEDCDSDKHKGRYYGPQHAAIFNLEDGTVQPHYPMEWRRIFPLPIWIEPTIQNGNT